MRQICLDLGDLRLEGSSLAGIETWFRVTPPGLAFDVGHGALPLTGAKDLFLSHGHLDHALGLPYLLSQRSLHHLADTRIFCPAGVTGDVEALIAAAARLEQASYRYELTGLAPGERVAVGKNLTVEAFATDHVVPSLGYHLFRTKRRLAEPFRGRSPAELAALRGEGVDTTEAVEELTLSYCGDTGPGIFDLEPRVFTSRVLLLECTFLGPKHRSRGVRYKHIHFDDLVAHSDRFENEHLVLHHLSRRYRPGELRRAVTEELSELAPRVHLVGEEE